MFDKLNAMKQQMDAMKASMDDLHVERDAQGLVKVTANGNGRIVNVVLDPKWLSTCDAEEAQDLIQLACNRAIDAASEAHANEMKKLAGGLLPGMF